MSARHPDAAGAVAAAAARLDSPWRSLERGRPITTGAELTASLVDLMESGRATVGDRLPPVRSLAEAIGLAPNTVAKVYRELAADGRIETRGRSGSFVAPGAQARDVALRAAAEAYARTAAELGATAAEARRTVLASLDRGDGDREPSPHGGGSGARGTADSGIQAPEEGGDA